MQRGFHYNAPTGPRNNGNNRSSAIKRINEWWVPISFCATGLIAFGTIKANLADLQTNISDLQAAKPYVLQEQIKAQDKSQAEFRQQMTESIAEMRKDVKAVGESVAHIRGQLDRWNQIEARP